MPRILFPALIAAAMTSATMTSAVLAQGLMNTFKEVGLNNDDFGHLRSAAESLYTAESPTIGSKATWQNADTQSHGEVELTEFDGTCATMEHVFRVGATKEVYKMPGRRCKSEDGQWLIAPLE